MRFPALAAGDIHFLWILIGSLRCLRLVIGQNNYFVFGFTTLNWKPLFWVPDRTESIVQSIDLVQLLAGEREFKLRQQNEILNGICKF